jgi:hypothetical protein
MPYADKLYCKRGRRFDVFGDSQTNGIGADYTLTLNRLCVDRVMKRHGGHQFDLGCF